MAQSVTCSLCPATEPTFTKAQSKKPASQRVCVDCSSRAEHIDNALKSQKLLLKILDHSLFALPGEKLSFPPPSAATSTKFSLNIDISFRCFNQDFILNFLVVSLTPITIGTIKALLLSETDLPKDFPINFYVNGTLLAAPQKTLWSDVVPDPSSLIELKGEPISMEEEILGRHYQKRKSAATAGDDLILLLALQCEPDFFKSRALERINALNSKEIPRLSTKILLEYLISITPDPFPLRMMILDLCFLFQVSYSVLDAQYEDIVKYAPNPEIRAELVIKKQQMNEKLNKDYWDTHNILAFLGPAMISRAIFPHLDLRSLQHVSRTSKGLNESFQQESYWEHFCKRHYSLHTLGVKKSPSWKTLFFCFQRDSKKPIYPHAYEEKLPHGASYTPKRYYPDPFLGKVESTDRWIPLLDTCVSQPDTTTIPQLIAVLQHVSVRDMNLHAFLWRFFKKFEFVKNPNKVDRAEWTKTLLEHGADPNLPFRNTSPIGFSILNGWPEVTRVLCLHGGSLDHPSIPTCLERLKKQEKAHPPENSLYPKFHELMVEKLSQRENTKSALVYKESRGWYHLVWGYPDISEYYNILWVWNNVGFFWPDRRDYGSPSRDEVRRFRHAPTKVIRCSFRKIEPFERLTETQLRARNTISFSTIYDWEADRILASQGLLW